MIVKSVLAWMVVPDETTQGKSCFTVYDLDLDGCMGQGSTPEEATTDWCKAREEYINGN